MTVDTDFQLIRLAKAGDRAAFDDLIGPLISQAFHLAFGMLHDRGAAEDAVQDAAVKSWRKLANLRPDTPIRPWFLAIVANQCRSAVRSRRWSVARFAQVDGAAGGEFEDRIVRGAALRAALQNLGTDQREALVLHYYLDLPLKEIASITGVPLGTVKSRINRALAAMRPHFEPMEAFG